MALALTAVAVTLFCCGLVWLKEWGEAQEAHEREERAKRALGPELAHLTHDGTRSPGRS